MDIDHSLITCGGNDHKSVALIRLKSCLNLCKSCKKNRLLAFEADEVRLFLLWVIWIFHPLKPPIRGRNCAPIRPKLLEELARRYRFDARINRCWTFIPSPKRSPTPAYLVDTQASLRRSNDFNAGRRRNVVTLDGPEVVPIDDLLLWSKLFEVMVHRFVDRVASAHDVTRNVTRRKCSPIRLTTLRAKS